MTRDLSETRIASVQLVDGLLMKAYRDEVRLPNGETGVREYIKHPGAVIMIPVFENGDTMLIRQFRYPVGKTFYELPAGKLDGNEDKDTAAQRELAEEIGFRAGKLNLIGSFYPCIGYSDERMWLYLGEDLRPVEAQGDSDEFLETKRLPMTEAIAMVRRGEIDDMKTVAALLIGHQFRNGR